MIANDFEHVCLHSNKTSRNLCTFSQPALVVLVWLLLNCAVHADPPTRLARIAILDKSGSMATPDRFPVAKDEILKLAAQLPPTPQAPFVIVTFDTDATAREFTSLNELQEYLGQLQIGSGTRIAAGLEAARKELARFAANGAVVLLYTDGEDTDQAGIEREEKQLDALFADRSRSGLNNILVCRRWANANARLVERLQQSPNVRVIDFAELRLVPVTYLPAFEIANVRWAENERAVDVDVKAAIRTRGAEKNTAIAPAVIECTTAAVAGDTRKSLRPNDSNDHLHIRLPLDAEHLAQGRADLTFAVSIDTRAASGRKELLLPVCDPDRYVLPVPLPPIDIEVLSAATGQPARWHDPISRQAHCPIELTLSVKTSLKWKWDAPVELTIAPDDPDQQIDGQRTVTLTGSAQERARVGALVPIADKAAEGKARLSVTARSASPNVRWVNDRVKHEVTFPAPPPITTTITTAAQSATAIGWTDLATGIAAFDADVLVRVEGPIAPGTDLAVTCPTGVRRFRCEPPRIHTGEQTLRITFQANVIPESNCKFAFLLTPPPPQGAVHINVPKPLTIQVNAPSPAQLGLADEDGPLNAVEISVADNATSALAHITPILLQAPDGHRMDVIVETAGPFGAATKPLSADVESFVEIDLPLPPASGSFWHDTVLTGEVRLTPRTPHAAVRGAIYPLQVRIEAPFKRYAFYGAALIGVLLLLWGGVALYGKLTASTENASRTKPIAEGMEAE